MKGLVDLIGHTHTCGGMPQCAACYTDRDRTIAAQAKEIAALTTEKERLAFSRDAQIEDKHRILREHIERCAAKDEEIARLRADVEHLRSQAGPDSCADLIAQASRLREIATELLRLRDWRLQIAFYEKQAKETDRIAEHEAAGERQAQLRAEAKNRQLEIDGWLSKYGRDENAAVERLRAELEGRS